MTTVPIVGKKIPGTASWHLGKPFTPLYIAVSAAGPFAAPEKVEAFQTEQLDFINYYLQAQGITRPNPDDLNELVNVRVWQESCYEFEHFTNEELADGIMAVHETIGGWTREEIIAALRQCRSERENPRIYWLILFAEGRFIGEAAWANKFGTAELAEALWPTLERKIERLKEDPEAPVPPIIQVVNDAYQQAQRRRNVSYMLTELPSLSDQE